MAARGTRGDTEGGRLGATDPNEAALLTATNVGLDVPTVEHMVRAGTNAHLQPIDDRTVAQQQEQAVPCRKVSLPSAMGNTVPSSWEMVYKRPLGFAEYSLPFSRPGLIPGGAGLSVMSITPPPF